MNVLVTGGGGFLGSNIALQLLEGGHCVRVFGRRSYRELESKGVQGCIGDVRDADAVSAACHGMDAVIHSAALAGVWGPRRSFYEINCVGTENVLLACRRNSVSFLVYTSSPSVVFHEADLCGVDESQPYPARFLSHYPATKAMAERRVLESNRDGLMTTALRPHLIFGPGDPHLLPRVIERARAGRLVQIGTGLNRVDVTFVTDAARAHVCVLDSLAGGATSPAGRAYFISQGAPVVLWPWLAKILSAVGAPPIHRRMSHRKARAMGTALEAGYRLLRIPREPPMTRFLADQLAMSHWFSIAAAARDFGYRPLVSMTDAVNATVEWLLSQNTPNIPKLLARHG